MCSVVHGGPRVRTNGTRVGMGTPMQPQEGQLEPTSLAGLQQPARDIGSAHQGHDDQESSAVEAVNFDTRLR